MSYKMSMWGEWSIPCENTKIHFQATIFYIWHSPTSWVLIFLKFYILTISPSGLQCRAPYPNTKSSSQLCPIPKLFPLSSTNPNSILMSRLTLSLRLFLTTLPSVNPFHILYTFFFPSLSVKAFLGDMFHSLWYLWALE